MKHLPQQVSITDVCARDGFQMEKNFIATEDKIKLINLLSKLGFPKLEYTSFVSPKAIAQMKDAEQVTQEIEKTAGVIYAALVPNLKGAQRAINAGADELVQVISVSEAHNLANVRMKLSDSLSNAKEIIRLSGQHNIPVTVGLATAFGCPYAGRVSPEQVLKLADQVLKLGAHSLVIADTTGMANPVQVYEFLCRFRSEFSDTVVSLHFHNTRGMAMANIVAGLEAGITIYETSLGGLGGCPFAPGATGNVATEDVVHMLEEMGIDTGINLEGVLEAARELERIIGRQLPGHVLKAGKVCDLHPLPSNQA
ncbi:MAG: hydroxymethylglutaryl-CoA lyase [Dethiobacter sp.]|jgi:hydroxymethylglutaryl-CoA lyase|nr:hydroxymethylglutaryl-CoA lyase [Dethiobacter sp.]